MMVFCIFLLDFQTLLHEFSIEPRTCQSLSRQVIRSRLNGLRQGRRLSLETLIDRLPLPGRLRDYLAIRDAPGSGAESMATSWHGNAFRITGHLWGDPLVNATCPDSKVRGANMGPTGPRWAPCCPNEPCYLGGFPSLRASKCGALMFHLLLAWTSCWTNIRVVGDLMFHVLFVGTHCGTINRVVGASSRTCDVTLLRQLYGFIQFNCPRFFPGWITDK